MKDVKNKWQRQINAITANDLFANRVKRAQEKQIELKNYIYVRIVGQIYQKELNSRQLPIIYNFLLFIYFSYSFCKINASISNFGVSQIIVPQ